MNKEMSAWEEWQAEVVRQVRFKYDHEAIKKELSAHYEDHVKDLERIGLETAEAEERALAAMGDAEEVGKGLDAAHKPLWGWLWQLSRVVIWTGFLLTLLMVTNFSWSARLIWSIENTFAPEGDLGGYETWADYWQAAGYTYGGPLRQHQSVEMGDYTLSLIRGQWWEKDGQREAMAVLRVRPRLYWYGKPEEALDDLHLTLSTKTMTPEDQRGTIILDSSPEAEEAREEGFCVTGANYVMPSSKNPREHFGKPSDDLTSRYLFLQVTTDTAPEWMELSHPYGGNDWAYRLLWEVEE